MAARTFNNEDEKAQYCLSVLRDGTDSDKIEARETLAAIFSRRGLFEDSAALYELNLRAGVRTPDLFERLSEVYRGLGDQQSAEAAVSEARRLRGTNAPAPLQPALVATPQSAPLAAPPAAPAPAPLVAPPATPPSTPPASPPTSEPEPRVIPFPAPTATPHPEQSPAPMPEPHGPPEPPSTPHSASEPRRQAPAEAVLANRPARSLPRPVLILGAVVFLIVLPIVLLALLVVNPLGLYLEGRAAGPIVLNVSDEPPTLKIAPGTTVTWYVQTGRSVSGLWATPGLELTLDQDLAGTGPVHTVTAPRAQTWGETITIVERRGQGRANQETVVPAAFEAPPALPEAGTVIEGRISGQVTAPRLSETSQFNTTTERVDVPVRLVVVSGFDLWLDRFGNAVRMYFDADRWLLVTIGALLAWCVLAGGAAILFRVRQS